MTKVRSDATGSPGRRYVLRPAHPARPGLEASYEGDPHAGSAGRTASGCRYRWRRRWLGASRQRAVGLGGRARDGNPAGRDEPALAASEHGQGGHAYAISVCPPAGPVDSGYGPGAGPVDPKGAADTAADRAAARSITDAEGHPAASSVTDAAADRATGRSVTEASIPLRTLNAVPAAADNCRAEDYMGRGEWGEAVEAEVPHLVGMNVRDARQAGHQAGLVVVSADTDGPPLGALTWPGVWIVTVQRPAPGTRLSRWDNVVIEFEEQRGGNAGDREPRPPAPDPGALAVDLEPPDEPATR
ncbi:MAG TPA: PASTA domain-containing protein [Streptosporangiaceae bacterium]